MKIYHTKTQEDYDALMEELEVKGCDVFPMNISSFYDGNCCVDVVGNEVSHSDFEFYLQTYPEIPIIEYTANKNKYKEGQYCCMPKKKTLSQAINDVVNSPSHYKQGERETIENIRDTMSSEGYQGYCVGNIVKYLSRYKFKNGLEDVRKAKKYIEFLEEELMKQEG